VTAILESLRSVWVDRDRSWLEFNRRVLAEALDDRTPLLERAKFLPIFTSNLDEFFMKRLALLREDRSPAGRELMAEIRRRLLAMMTEQADTFLASWFPSCRDITFTCGAGMS
jgi:polyphosphate kinase